MTTNLYSWVVRFTVAPVWVADGFSLSDERAAHMLAKELGYADNSELAAVVLEAPSALHMAREQGYSAKDHRSRGVIEELRNGTPNMGAVHRALIAARDVLDSVAFVGQPGDTAKPLALIAKALDDIDARPAPVDTSEADAAAALAVSRSFVRGVLDATKPAP